MIKDEFIGTATFSFFFFVVLLLVIIILLLLVHIIIVIFINAHSWDTTDLSDHLDIPIIIDSRLVLPVMTLFIPAILAPHVTVVIE